MKLRYSLSRSVNSFPGSRELELPERFCEHGNVQGPFDTADVVLAVFSNWDGWMDGWIDRVKR
jgi:hypothetical protein